MDHQSRCRRLMDLTADLERLLDIACEQLGTMPSRTPFFWQEEFSDVRQ
ncbi:hypothetical protein [Mesorhizobium sp. M1B.F.Ca.ET.045.04.1.1]|nr:hypothetical protein [Mesorhizobium sp. M1B.F.Ca.ET.045.04.1.1]